MLRDSATSSRALAQVAAMEELSARREAEILDLKSALATAHDKLGKAEVTPGHAAARSMQGDAWVSHKA